MNRVFRLSVVIACAAVLTVGTMAVAESKSIPATDVWQFVKEVPQARAAGRPWVRPQRFQAMSLNYEAMKQSLRAAPMEVLGFGARNSGFVVELPMPDGSIAAFEVVESPVMEEGLARLLPDVRTYLGQGLTDPTATVRFDVTPQGFHSQVISGQGVAYIDPYTFGDTEYYSCYWKRDNNRPTDFQCLIPEAELAEAALAEVANENAANPRTSGTTLRTYRLANAATGEYTVFHGGTQALGQAAVVTAVNRVNQIYELEVDVHFNLVANNINLIFTDGLTDPYTNNNGATMLGENQTRCDLTIGSANYDIGHVYSTGGGGIASLGVVCAAGSKARGVTGTSSPIGDNFVVDYVTHEMGHQFNALHTFNGVGGSCAGNRSASAAYERGSATTIMGYAGICGSVDNIQNHSDAYFVFHSHNQIMSFITPLACDVETPTGNNVPTVNAGVDYNIPNFTPFMLTASGSDADVGDALTYCWEEADLGPAQAANLPDNGSSPLFRSRTGTSDTTRTCPILSLLLANNFTAKGEQMPNTTRSLNWRCTVRDNRAGGGGVNADAMLISVTSAGGSFGVTAPDTAVSWSGTQTVTWTVGGTSGPPVNCANVNIRLSTDGGNTFPTLLLGSTPNDGSQSVTLPNINTTTARVKVEAVGNIFFDISAANFTITPGIPNAPTGVTASPPAVCSGGACNLNGTVNAGEVVDWYTGGCGTGGGGTLIGTGSPLGVNPVSTTLYYAQGRNTGSGLVGPCTTVSVVVPGLGDANGSGAVDISDVQPFADGIVAGTGLPCALDMNGDTLLNGADIVLFTDLISP